MIIYNTLKNTYPKIIHANGIWDNSVKEILNKINLEYKQGDGLECFHYNNVEINNQTELFLFNSNNINLDEEIGIYTWNNKISRDKWLFELVCDINKLKYTNLITQKKFTTFDKLYTINKEIKRLKLINSPIKYLFCCDSKDVFFIDHPNNFIKEFLKDKNYKMIINAETNDYPNNTTIIESQNQGPFKYLNSGAYIAQIDFLEEFTNYCLSLTENNKSKFLNDPHCFDQFLFKKSYENFKNDCLLDCNSDLFLCLYNCNPNWLNFM